MNTLIPVEYYTVFYYNMLWLVVLGTYLQGVRSALDSNENIRKKNVLGNLFLFLLLFYIGLRPISGRYFGDMRTYANVYARYAAGEPVLEGKDIYFEYFMKWCSSIMNVEFFFFMCAALYVFPLYYAVRKLFQEYWFYAFLMLVISMSFWAYGTNGIRNGIGTSLFIFAITLKDKKYKILILVLAVLFHKSMLIPILAFVITSYYKNTRHMLIFWMAAIPLSIVLGSFWEQTFLNFGFGDEDRLQGYLSDEENEFQEQFSSLGFRWDFLVYSATGVFAGWYFVIKKKFEDPLYSQIFNIYLLANAFWILVIRATFSNRFAYLSWFLLGIVIIYPMLKMQFFHKHHQTIGRIFIIYYLFTYFINVIMA